MKKNLATTYAPHEFEDRIYKTWEEKGGFRATVDETKKPYTIVMPPPNITGQLHMGHALDQTLQDVLIRWKRMEGYSALWIPGSDHASIATEVKVVEKLREEEGKGKEDIGRDAFLKKAWEWKELYGGKITKQCRKIGDSCDWERERFTMDEGCNKAVTKLFVDLYEKGLIYRGNRLINWCPTCGTSLSDAEVEHEEKEGKYWYFRYPLAEGQGKVMGHGEFEGQELDGVVIATSRPETMFADVAIAVHPEDARYKELIGKKVIIPLTGREIPVIKDQYPDPEKGTGAVKITPAHDANDFEVGERHKLQRPVCIDFDAKMTELAGKYQGLDRYQCRKAWIKDLEEEFLVKIEDISIPIGGCYRCNTVVEPMLSDQWFVAMEKLAGPAIDAVKNKDVEHVPERFEKTYLHWLENIRDWCVSRQLWWGHRIPAYYCQDCKEITVSEHDPKKCSRCGSANIKQDEDVLDTWFSSALWPFSTLGWPEKTKDLEYFYPTNVLVTGYDIIFFWVVRMVFSALYATGEAPFKYVYVHGLVRDGEGRKMSKSLGNGIDPLEIIEEFGTDAFRFMLTTGITPGNDMRFKTDKLEASRNFANKLWNASRFVIMNLQDQEGRELPIERDLLEETLGQGALDKYKDDLKDEDKWILSRVNEATKYATAAMEKFDLALAGQRVYEVIWNEYCDWYIEIAKNRLYGEDEEDKKIVRAILTRALRDMLKLLHPFMPFITEEIWSYLPNQQGETLNKTKDEEQSIESFLIKASWPKYNQKLIFEKEVSHLEFAMSAIKAIRNLRAEVEAPMSKALSMTVLPDLKSKEALAGAEGYIKKLANINQISEIDKKEDIPPEVGTAVVDGAEFFIPLDELLDYKAEWERLKKERGKLEGEVKRIDGKLSNQGFISKAPENVVAEEKEKLEKYGEMLAKVIERLAQVEKKI